MDRGIFNDAVSSEDIHIKWYEKTITSGEPKGTGKGRVVAYFIRLRD